MSADSQDTPDPSIEPPTSGDRFSPDNLKKFRLSQNFSAVTEVKRVITSVSVRKPKKQEFFRVRTGEDWWFETLSFRDEETGEFYLIEPELCGLLGQEARPTCLVLIVTRTSPIPILWPLIIPDPDRPNDWHVTALDAARRAQHEWVKVTPDMHAGRNDIHVAVSKLDEPDWPEDLEMPDYLRLAFKDRMIDSVNHPVLKRLRGEI